MTLTDIIAVAVIAAVVGLAVMYIVKERKKGNRCIGCPHAKTCAKNSKENSCCCNGAENDSEKK